MQMLTSLTIAQDAKQTFLCHESYCESYRPGARRGMAPDTGSSHVGFRLVRR
jgi:formylglycine-generating enzyme required for sulfatase activity